MKKPTPRSARTFEQICKLPRDNVDSGDFWLQLDVDTLTIAEQKVGEKPTQSLTIPRRVFERLADFYNTGSMKPASAGR